MRSSARSGPRSSALRVLDGLLYIGVPLLVVVMFLGDAYHRGILGFDFEHFLLPAARAVADGNSPYPNYQYPPLVAFALVPLTVVPGPNIVFVLLLIACVPASLWLLGVRDWRCYGVVFVWPPVLAGLQTSNVTIPLLLGTALCWRYRERWKIVALAGGLAVAAKLLCAPIVLWLVATRRFLAAVGIAIVAGAVSAVLWAAIGFSGAVDYPSNISKISNINSAESFTLKVVLQDVGIGSGAARLVWAAVALAVAAAAVWLGWKGDDQRSFSLAVASMIVAVPVVWLHSFALLLAPVAVMRPRLGLVWLVPLLFVIGPGTGNGAPWQTAGVLAVMALTLLLALRPARDHAAAEEPEETELRAIVT